MRTLLLSKADELYLEKCAQEHRFSYGIIIGHQADLSKTFVVHLARNNEEDADLEDLTEVGLTISDISSQALASQWLSASKMCPGSFDVIGIFVASTTDQSSEIKTAKKLFSDVYDILLKSNKSLGIYTTDVAQSDYVFLSYSLANKQVLCKSYTYGNGGTFSNMEYKFVEKPFEWIQLECMYDLEDILPIVNTARRINIEDQFQNIILAFRKNILVSEVFLQNEIVEDTIDLQTYIKKRKSKEEKLKAASSNATTPSSEASEALHLLNSQGFLGGSEIIRASILLPVKCQLAKPTDIKVREFNGTLRTSGIITTRIFCSPRNSIADAKRFLRDDILRSLTTRIQVYCDGLTDPYATSEAIFISEPPRRVFFSLPSEGPSTSGGVTVQFSEYLFRGEAPTVVVAQAKQILDVELDPEAIGMDAEGLPDDVPIQTSQDQADDTRSMASSMPKPELSRSLYMVGIAVALLVLLTSVALHYMLTDK
ncbi:LOW QUALITY PROTEIN: protein odr-4 homolog [Drosophila obscura]|uniref:LOW QUALITY PROTEIN: protein odr-4 homolog n=1 Tax=Drosophila obscura TaxID=7282 RepID=UPI000B9F9A36|nr:LOW QUALITY PROTEIN: protein odr-4 homolog [Drosophila obscura]